jgi:hypothetical protein
VRDKISSGGMSAVALNRRNICQACGDTRCSDCCMSFLHRGKSGKLVRIFIKNKQVSKIESVGA